MDEAITSKMCHYKVSFKARESLVCQYLQNSKPFLFWERKKVITEPQFDGLSSWLDNLFICGIFVLFGVVLKLKRSNPDVVTRIKNPYFDENKIAFVVFSLLYCRKTERSLSYLFSCSYQLFPSSF